MEGIKKKIVFTVTNDLSHDQRMMRICGTLATHGYDVLLVGRKRKHSIPLVQQMYAQKRLNCFFDKGVFFYMEYNLRLFLFLLFKYADIYGAIDLDTLLPNTIISKMKSRKLVFDAHEYFTEVPEVTHRKFIKSVWSLIEKLCVPQAHLCYTVSESLARLFSEQFNKPFALVRNIPPYQPVAPSTPNASDKPIVIYQGDLNEGRGLEEAIVAIKDLDVVLKIAGDGPLKQKLIDLIAQHQVQHKVQLLGYIEPAQLKAVTASASIGLNVLAHTGLSYYYSLSNKFFNYIHAGIPQICANFPEYQLMNSHYEVAVLIDLTPEHITQSIQRLLTDKTLYQRLQQQCTLAAAQYTWEVEAQTLVTCFDELR